MGGTLDAV